MFLKICPLKKVISYTLKDYYNAIYQGNDSNKSSYIEERSKLKKRYITLELELFLVTDEHRK